MQGLESRRRGGIGLPFRHWRFRVRVKLHRGFEPSPLDDSLKFTNFARNNSVRKWGSRDRGIS